MNTPEHETMSSLSEKALAALEAAVAKVVEDHRRRGAPLAVWRDGKAVWEMPPPIDNAREESGVYPLKENKDNPNRAPNKEDA